MNKGKTGTVVEGTKNLLFRSFPADLRGRTGGGVSKKEVLLRSVGVNQGGVVLNKKACIRAGELIRSKATK